MPLSPSILARLKYQHETVAELIDGLSEDQLKKRINPDKWSAFENIVHLVSYQPTFLTRLGRVVQENNPVFERYVADNDPLFNSFLQKPIAELLSIQETDRQAILKTISSFDEDQLLHRGRHPRFGTLTVSQWSNLFLLHEAHHLWTILQLITPFSTEA
jgi:uncharacterized damage-inducible protein DinB